MSWMYALRFFYRNWGVLVGSIYTSRANQRHFNSILEVCKKAKKKVYLKNRMKGPLILGDFNTRHVACVVEICKIYGQSLSTSWKKFVSLLNPRKNILSSKGSSMAEAFLTCVFALPPRYVGIHLLFVFKTIIISSLVPRVLAIQQFVLVCCSRNLKNCLETCWIIVMLIGIVYYPPLR